MAANLRIRLKLEMEVGPLRPVGKADVYLAVQPEPDGTARVDITRVVFVNNLLFTAVAVILKERMTEQINDLVKSFIHDLPNHIPGVGNISILEISEEFPP